MVQLYSTFFVLASLIVSGISAPNAKRTVEKIKGDLVDISAEINALNTAVVGLPINGGTVAQALVCKNFAATLLTSFPGLILTLSRCVIVIGDSLERRPFVCIIKHWYGRRQGKLIGITPPPSDHVPIV
jgi:hypothetical protein